MNSEKVPSPDGFSMVFFQVSWEVIKVVIIGVFHDFQFFFFLSNKDFIKKKIYIYKTPLSTQEQPK